jgi:hypothetical protein
MEEALKLSRSRDVEYGAAFALALSGDNVGSEHLVKDLQKRSPEDTCVKFTYLTAPGMMGTEGTDNA